MNLGNKLLYIGIDIEKPKTGGESCLKRNESALRELFGENFYKYSLFYDATPLRYLISRLFLFYPGISFSTFKKVKDIIQQLKPQFIFISSSHYGNLVKYIKKYFLVTVITFFHNIEIQYAKSYLSFLNIKSLYFFVMTKLNEAYSVKYSDKCIVINDRDADIYEQVYKRQADCVLPFSIIDILTTDKIATIKQTTRFINKHECLFVGSNFYANIHGLTWFIKKILPYVNIHLSIIGTGMLKAFSDTDKITVMDYVDDLSEYYIHSDFIISPIFLGGGMKTKTAEAMMWGKAIVGTDEAFRGYEIDSVHGLYRCNTVQEMTETIQSIYSDTVLYFNQNIRELFLTKYSFNNTIELFIRFFESI
jgi:glycosyltransferase involved in cell wall biosynthesis